LIEVKCTNYHPSLRRKSINPLEMRNSTLLRLKYNYYWALFNKYQVLKKYGQYIRFNSNKGERKGGEKVETRSFALYGLSQQQNIPLLLSKDEEGGISERKKG
jgi:hypothetical protein